MQSSLQQSLSAYLESNPLSGPEQRRAEMGLEASGVLIEAARADAQARSNAAHALLDKAQSILGAIGPVILRMGVGFVPVVGDVADLVEAVTGRDMVSGDELSFGERSLAMLGIVAGSRALYESSLKGLKELLKESEGLADGITRTLRRYGSEVNKEARYAKYSEPVWSENRKVLDFKTTKTEVFYRVYGGGTEEKGGFIMRIDPRNSTKAEIKDRFALPDTNAMSNIREVQVPPGFALRSGVVSPNKFGKGGAIQYEMLDKLSSGWGEPVSW